MKAISFLLLVLLMACASEPKMETWTDLNEAKSEKFQQCYHESDLYMWRKPGKIEISYQISADGHISDAKVTKADFKDPNLKACILGIVKQIKYMPPKDGKAMQVFYPLNFYPELHENF